MSDRTFDTADHPQLDRLTALRADVGIALATAAATYKRVLRYPETNEERSAATTTQLWDDLLVALVTAWEGPAEEMLAYVADTLELKRPPQRIAIVGTIVDDPVMGNRVVWNGESRAGAPGARPDSLL